MLELPRLYAIVDAEVCARAGWLPRDLGRAYLAGGARLLQLRAKTLGSGDFLELAAIIAEDVAAAGGALIVNDRADVAALAGAAGVHVGQEDLRPEDVRLVTGDEAIVGLSTHTTIQIDEALNAAISYLAIGPVFGTTTKDTGYAAVGVQMVADAVARASRVSMPVVAIGGITLSTAPRVIAAGAASVAVITDLMVGNPETRVREYLALLA